ncbi:MAG TPA: tyrosine-protein phosphatase [Bdellovibrionota bacterium]|nr:tyrosine-protein phosphatase [Bdellovibrionota bacterium]
MNPLRRGTNQFFARGLLVVGLVPALASAEECSPGDYAEFMARYQTHKSAVSRYIADPAGRVSEALARSRVSLGSLRLGGAVDADRLKSIGVSVLLSDAKRRWNDHREASRIRVLDALEDARDLVSNRKTYSAEAMPDLAVLLESTEARLRRTEPGRELTPATLATLLLSESPAYCKVTSKGPELLGVDDVAGRVAGSLGRNGGVPTDAERGAASALAEPPNDAELACDPAKYVRHLAWKRRRDGGGRWQTYARMAVEQAAKDGLKDVLGFSTLGATTASNFALNAGWLALKHWRAGKKIKDRRALMDAIEASHRMTEQGATTTNDAAFLRLLEAINEGRSEDQKMKPGLLAAGLAGAAEDFCRFDHRGFPVLASTKEALDALEPDSEGKPVVRFAPVEAGVLYRSSQPMTQQDLETLARPASDPRGGFGIRTLISLRNDSSVFEERVQAGALGMKVINVPLNNSDHPSPETIQRIENLLLRIKLSQDVRDNPQRYPPGSYNSNDLIELPALVHCQHGKDRTGLFSLLYRVINQGLDPECAIREMYDMDFRRKNPLTANIRPVGLESYVRERFKVAAERAAEGDNPSCPKQELDAEKLTLERAIRATASNPSSPINQGQREKNLPEDGTRPSTPAEQRPLSTRPGG